MKRQKMGEELWTALTSERLVLAFVIDQGELKKRLNTVYVKKITPLARVEDNSHVETRNSQFRVL